MMSTSSFREAEGLRGRDASSGCPARKTQSRYPFLQTSLGGSLRHEMRGLPLPTFVQQRLRNGTEQRRVMNEQ